jgi:YYY domain-containing protein
MGIPGADIQVLSVISWLLILTLLQLSLWPYLRKAIGELAFPVAFPASILLFTLISWYCGLVRVPVQIALVPFIVLLLVALYRRDYTLKNISGEWKWEFLFLVCFLFMLNVRFVNPSISFAEKFMDHGFIASVMRDPVVPPLDPWFSGGYMNVYYYLGYWTIGTLGVVSGAPSSIVFNLALPTVFALSAVTMYALGHLLLERFRWILLATFLIVNPSFLYEAVRGTPAGSLFWNSTRTIPNAINEFPLFSLLWGDVHPHLIGMFNQVFFIFLLVFSLKKWGGLTLWGRWCIIGLSALSLGAMPLINTWDILLYAPFMVLIGVLVWYVTVHEGEPHISDEVPGIFVRLSSRVRSALKCVVDAIRDLFAMLRKAPGHIADTPWGYLLIVPPLSVLLWAPFYFQLNTQGIQGIGLVLSPTGLPEFLLVHGIFFLIFIAYLWMDIVKRPWLILFALPFALAGYLSAAVALVPLIYLVARWRPDPVEILAMAGLVIIIFCEFFYLRDSMGDVYYRMNTVFKFYFAAWLLLGASGFAMLGMMLARWVRPLTIPVPARYVLALVLAIGFILLPLVIPATMIEGPRSLDGLAYINSSHPNDAAAVAWLRTLPGNITIVEAESGDYTYYSRISSFTGIPTIIGWPFHEFMWRGDTSGWYGIRMNDVRSIYENPKETVALMKKYNATLLYVGDSERARYHVNLASADIIPVYEHGDVKIYTPRASAPVD